MKATQRAHDANDLVTPCAGHGLGASGVILLMQVREQIRSFRQAPARPTSQPDRRPIEDVVAEYGGDVEGPARATSQGHRPRHQKPVTIGRLAAVLRSTDAPAP